MADRSKIQTDGGQKYTAVAAGTTAADAVLSAKPGRINRVVVNTAGTDVLVLHDHATASGSGRAVWSSPSTYALGAISVLDIPVANGIVALKANGSAAATVYFTEDGVTGGVADKAEVISDGGQYSSHHAAGTGGASAALAAPGRLCLISILSSGSAATIIYDNASAASGTKLFTVPATPTVGDVYSVQAPCLNGIFVGGATNTSNILVTYNKAGAYGR